MAQDHRLTFLAVMGVGVVLEVAGDVLFKKWADHGGRAWLISGLVVYTLGAIGWAWRFHPDPTVRDGWSWHIFDAPVKILTFATQAKAEEWLTMYKLATGERGRVVAASMDIARREWGGRRDRGEPSG